MRTLHFNKNSWHYKAALLASSNHYDIPENFCNYFWRVFLGLFLTLLLIWVVVIFAFLTVIAPILYLVVCLQYGTFGAPVEVVVGGVLDIIIMIGVAHFYITENILPEYKKKRAAKRLKLMEDGIYPESTPKEPGFIVTAWRTFKNKTCFKIEFED